MIKVMNASRWNKVNIYEHYGIPYNEIATCTLHFVIKALSFKAIFYDVDWDTSLNTLTLTMTFFLILC